MSLYIILRTCNLFFKVIEYFMFFYFILSWIPGAKTLREMMSELLEPIFAPIRSLLKHSIFNTPRADLAPVISFCIVLFLQDVFLSLSMNIK